MLQVAVHPLDKGDSLVDKNTRQGGEQSQGLASRRKAGRARQSIVESTFPSRAFAGRVSSSSPQAAWPERLYVVGTDGRIAYKGGMGPFRFDTDELETFLAAMIPTG